MESNQINSLRRSWLEASGLVPLFGILRLAYNPAKIGTALIGIIATFILGMILESLWKPFGGGVGADAITQFIAARELDQVFVEPDGDHGIFTVWREHQRKSLLGLLTSAFPGSSLSLGTPLGSYVESHAPGTPLRYLVSLYYANWWLVRHHFIFSVLLGAGALIIWSLCGGVICRQAAVQFARQEKPTFFQAFQFTLDKLWSGFVLAQCIPLAFVAFIVILMIVFGLIFRLPWVGDIVGGILFFLPILGGILITVIMAGMLLGGGLLWPSVAVESCDAFDAFQRSVSYSLTKAWKTLYYGILVTVYASVCWIVANLGMFIALRITRATVSFGSSYFGLWPRTTEPRWTTKVEHLWPMADPNAMYSWPSGDLGVFEYFSAACIGFWVLIVIGLMWAFLASIYFCACTVVYYLLRRDVDEIDLDEVFVDEKEPSNHTLS